MYARRAALSVAFAAGLALAPALAAPPDAGVVEEVSGSLSAANLQGKRDLSARDEVFLGDDVATAALSRARLALGRDTVVRLGENASLRIEKVLLDAGGVLTVGAGAVLLDKTPSKGPTRVKGGFGLITVRGTRVFAGPSNGVFGVFVAHGVVDLTSGGVTVTLRDGEGSDVARRGATPTPPKAWERRAFRRPWGASNEGAARRQCARGLAPASPPRWP